MKNLPLIVSIVIGLLIVIWLPLYFFFGVDPLFLKGFIEGKLFGNSRRIIKIVSTPTGTFKGFTYNTFATGLTGVRAISYQNGVIYAATANGEVRTLFDTKHTGTADKNHLFTSGLDNPEGILPLGNKVYVAQKGKVTLLTDQGNTGSATSTTDIISDLPAGLFQTNALTLGPNGSFYIAQGATSDHGEFGIKENEASVLQAYPNGVGLAVFATGLRNPKALVFDSQNMLFALDQGQSVPSYGVPDELNLITKGSNYGWPNCWGDNEGNNCKTGSIKPVALLEEHGGASGLVFYNKKQFPSMYRGNFFVSLAGSTSGDPNIGRKVVRVILTKTGNTYQSKVEDFITGLDKPVSMTLDNEGNLYIAEANKGEILRFSAVYK